MKQYKLSDGKEICIPENWSEITVKQLIEMQSCQGNSITAQNKLITLMTGISTDDLTFDDYINISLEITQSLQKPMNKSFKKYVQFDNIQFVAKDIKDFSTREFTDFDTIASANNNEQMPLLLGIIYSKVNEDREYVESVKQNAKLFEEKMDAETALAAVTFFSNALLAFVKNTVDSSDQARKMMEKNPTLKNQMKMITDYLALAGN